MKIKFKILISEKFGILQSIYSEQEKKVIETQNKLIYILNKEDMNYLEKMNTYLEQIRINKNEKKMMEFIEEYNKLIIKLFDDNNDFEDKYKLFMAQKLVEKSNKYIKENILDKHVKNFFNENFKNIDNLFQIINSQHNDDIESLKKQFNHINTDFNLNEDKKNSKLKEKNNNQIKSNNNNSKNNNKSDSKLELLKIEFNPPEIEKCQLTEKELKEMDMNDDYENEFLKIEEDGDDGLLLAEIIDGNCSENASVNTEQFYIDN